MDKASVEQLLRENIDRPVRVSFSDGETLTLFPQTVDDEGFVFTEALDTSTGFFWTPFEEVVSAEPASATHD